MMQQGNLMKTLMGMLSGVVCGVLLSTSSFAMSDQVSPAQLALAQQLTAIDGSKAALEVANQFAIEQLKVSMPIDTPAAFYTHLNAHLDVDSTHRQTTRVMAIMLSDTEIKKLIEFYQSAEGKSIAQKMGPMAREFAVISNRAFEQALIQSIEELEATPH